MIGVVMCEPCGENNFIKVHEPQSIIDMARSFVVVIVGYRYAVNAQTFFYIKFNIVVIRILSLEESFCIAITHWPLNDL